MSKSMSQQLHPIHRLCWSAQSVFLMLIGQDKTLLQRSHGRITVCKVSDRHENIKTWKLWCSEADPRSIKSFSPQHYVHVSRLHLLLGEIFLPYSRLNPFLFVGSLQEKPPPSSFLLDFLMAASSSCSFSCVGCSGPRGQSLKVFTQGAKRGPCRVSKEVAKREDQQIIMKIHFKTASVATLEALLIMHNRNKVAV